MVGRGGVVVIDRPTTVTPQEPGELEVEYLFHLALQRAARSRGRFEDLRALLEAASTREVARSARTRALADAEAHPDDRTLVLALRLLCETTDLLEAELRCRR